MAGPNPPANPKVKTSQRPRELHEGEISEVAADCLYWWSKGMEKQIYEFLVGFAETSFETGIFDILGDDPIYSEEGIRNRLDEISQSWSGILCNPLDRSASTVGKRLAELAKSYTDTDSRQFWRSHLGQLIFYRDGFPSRMLTKGEAIAVLHTTPMNVERMVKSGYMEFHIMGPGPLLLDRGDVIKEWQRRTGLIVGNAKMLRIG